MSARDEILNTLRQQAHPTPLPSAWTPQPPFADPVAKFTKALTAVYGEVHHAVNLVLAVEVLVDLLREIEAKKVVVNGESPLPELGLDGRWPDIDWYFVGKTAGDLRQFCATADVGISGADGALAETGSVIVSSGPGRSRLATLLPPVHIALVPTTLLTTDLITWTAVRQKPFPANINIISGPSKTADIEQTMAVGVHGPKRFIVILYDA